MKTDLYTKTILTVIAICLGILVFQNMNVITTVQASVPVAASTALPAATHSGGVVDVNIVQIAGVPFNKHYVEYGYDALLPVRIVSDKTK